MILLVSQVQTIKLLLKEPLINADGTPTKDTSKISPQAAQMLTPEAFEKLPNFSFGEALLALINNKKNCKDLEEMAKMQRLLVSLRNKLETNKGEWSLTKDDLIELENLFKTTPINELNVTLHGQMYNKIKDLLRQVNWSLKTIWLYNL